MSCACASPVWSIVLHPDQVIARRKTNCGRARKRGMVPPHVNHNSPVNPQPAAIVARHGERVTASGIKAVRPGPADRKVIRRNTRVRRACAPIKVDRGVIANSIGAPLKVTLSKYSPVKEVVDCAWTGRGAADLHSARNNSPVRSQKVLTRGNMIITSRGTRAARSGREATLEQFASCARLGKSTTGSFTHDTREGALTGRLQGDETDGRVPARAV